MSYILSGLCLGGLFFSDMALAGKKHKVAHSSHHASKIHHKYAAKVHLAHHKRVKLAHHSTKHSAKHRKVQLALVDNSVTLPIIKQTESDNSLNVNPHVLDLALKAYNRAFQKGYIKQKILTIIDYSLPSSKKRMWVVDVYSKKVLYHTLVAHGKHTGGLFATHFSDSPGSRASSIGTFITENTYMGSKGYSLRLRGLEPGFNTMAHSRAIVMHGAWYATANFAAHHGRLGLSWGCPAVSPVLAKPIINDIKGGSLVFAYYPDNHWLKQSEFLM